MLDEAALLDFDRSRLAHWSQEGEDQALRDHRDLYLNHLAIAKHLDGWVERLGEDPQHEDFAQALREVGAHLRQGDYLPDGAFIQQFWPDPLSREKAPPEG